MQKITRLSIWFLGILLLILGSGVHASLQEDERNLHERLLDISALLRAKANTADLHQQVSLLTIDLDRYTRRGGKSAPLIAAAGEFVKVKKLDDALTQISRSAELDLQQARESTRQRMSVIEARRGGSLGSEGAYLADSMQLITSEEHTQSIIVSDAEQKASENRDARAKGIEGADEYLRRYAATAKGGKKK